MSGIQQSFGFWRSVSGAASSTGWFSAQYSISDVTATGDGSTVDALGNFYQVGDVVDGSLSNKDLTIVKYNNSGVVQWKKILAIAGGTTFDSAQGVAVDSSGNVYVVGGKSTGIYNSPTTAFLLKYDINGVFQWGKSLYQFFGSSYLSYVKVAISSSQEIFVIGGFGSAASLAKYDSSGNIIYAQTLYNSSGSGYNTNFTDIKIDSASTYVYVVGTTTIVPGVGFSVPEKTNIVIAKYDIATFALVWQRRLYGTDGDVPLISTGYGLAIDSSGNVYVSGKINTDFIVDKAYLAKLDSNGNLLWQKSLQGPGFLHSIESLVCDSSNNVYGVGNTWSPLGGLIVKYDSSGNLLWQRSLTSSTSQRNSISISPNFGSIYLTGYGHNSYLSPGTIFMVGASLPSDGTLTGTYTYGIWTWTYVVATTPEVSSSLASVVSTLVTGSLSVQQGTVTVTDSIWPLTQTLVPIPYSPTVIVSPRLNPYAQSSAPNASSARITFNTNGTIEFIDSATSSGSTTWASPSDLVVGSSYWIKATDISGSGPSGMTSGVIYSLATAQYIQLTTSFDGQGISGNGTIDIYSDAGGTTRVGGGTYELYAQWTSSVVINNALNPTAQSSEQGPSSAIISFNNDGSIGYFDPAISYGSTNWATPTTAGIGSSYWIKVTRVSGITPSGMNSGVIYSLSTNRSIQITTVFEGQIRLAYGTIDIYSDAGGTTRVGGGNYDMNAEWYF